MDSRWNYKTIGAAGRMLPFTMLLCIVLTGCKAGMSWKKAWRSGEAALGAAYTADALKITPDGQVFRGPEAIAASYRAWREDQPKLAEVIAAGTFIASEKKGYTYEIGGFRTPDGREWHHLLILKTEDGRERRELEIVVPDDPKKEQRFGELDAARARWMTLCNAHDAYKLVAEMYTPDALYYNHKPLVIGTEGIAKEYSYMNRESYSLKLTPLAIEFADGRQAFEIGQCSGSYNGKYMLYWKKNDVGKWQVFFDSNI